MRIEGCLVAIVTPFRDGQVDDDALAGHATWLVDEGVDGIVVCGTTGEAATMHNDEKLRAMRVVIEAVGDRATIVGGAGNNSTSESLAFLPRSNDIPGLDAVMSVVPYYNKPPQAGISAHSRAIADASEHPVVIYNVPSRTVAGMTMETMAALARHPNVIGVKEASADLLVDTRLLARLPDDVTMLSGDDATSMPFLALGGHGTISVVGNIAPRTVAEMCDAMAAGDLATARARHATICELHTLLFSTTSPIPVKAAMWQMGLCGPDIRLPLVPMAETDAETLMSQLSELGVEPVR